MKNLDFKYVSRRYGFRSGLEEIISKQLRDNNINPNYETVKLPYVVNKNCKYTPDFPMILNNKGIVIETKGYFTTEDRMKMLLLKTQYPDIDFRFIFTNPNSKISKASKTTYAMWCEKHGFKYTKKIIPNEWLDDLKEEERKIRNANK